MDIGVIETDVIERLGVGWEQVAGLVEGWEKKTLTKKKKKYRETENEVKKTKTKEKNQQKGEILCFHSVFHFSL